MAGGDTAIDAIGCGLIGQWLSVTDLRSLLLIIVLCAASVCVVLYRRNQSLQAGWRKDLIEQASLRQADHDAQAALARETAATLSRLTALVENMPRH